ncbi:MAG: glycosyltransferase [Flavobacterium sp.]|nr:MAG: glycosyltransferase [Flavobacterium sp.]
MLAKPSKISIVTPSFNQGRYIEQTICSVLDQGYSNLEYIIIDGGSTDETLAIIKKYERHLTFWVSEKDKGQTNAINKGYVHCTGEIFNWINSDDYYEPGTFEKLAAYFSDSRVDVVCGKEWAFYDQQPDNIVNETRSFISQDLYKTIRAGIIDQPCTFFRRKKIASFFPLHVSLRYVMDRQLWWQYLLQNGQDRILQVEDVFTRFRLHEESKSILEGHYFSDEFEQLKESLFRQLHAPDDLLKQVKVNAASLPLNWPVRSEQREQILAAFASSFAERRYVEKNRIELKKLTALLKSWKGYRMDTTEWKWWLTAHCLPSKAFHYLKNRNHP